MKYFKQIITLLIFALMTQIPAFSMKRKQDFDNLNLQKNKKKQDSFYEQWRDYIIKQELLHNIEISKQNPTLHLAAIETYNNYLEYLKLKTGTKNSHKRTLEQNSDNTVKRKK